MGLLFLEAALSLREQWFIQEALNFLAFITFSFLATAAGCACRGYFMRDSSLVTAL